MDILMGLGRRLADGRCAANLIAFYGLIVAAVVGSLVLRRLLAHGGNRLARIPGFRWLDHVSQEVARRGRALLFWCTALTVVITVIIGLGYHFTGGDVREDATSWFKTFRPADVIHVGLTGASLLALALATAVGVGFVRRLRPFLQVQLHRLIGRPGNEEPLRLWFGLLERYLVAAFRLTGLWGAGQVVGLGAWADSGVGFVLRVLTILAAARLLTLSCRTLSRTVADIGDRHLGKRPFQRYWERVTRLFPFGERCFEAAVYVSAASMCVRALHFITVVADFGPRIVQCIGILFGTRVIIELLQVLLNEAFGLYDDAQQLDQKGRTLVPLLHSVCQYVLYFGSFVIMLGVLGIDTRPILAGAGILGLAVGLGAQNLVTDVVSGFFILFENQYLVGDYVQVGDASGVVESVGIRLTQIRDGQGKLYLIPNGQIKGVVNYSKGYINAVVDLRVPTGSDVQSVFRAMTEAGRRLRQQHPQVLADTEVQGLVDLGTSEMTVRAVTRVQPGMHGMMQNEYRRLLKEAYEQAQSPRKPAVAA